LRTLTGIGRLDRTPCRTRAIRSAVQTSQMQVISLVQGPGMGITTASGGGWGENVSVLRVARSGEGLSGIKGWTPDLGVRDLWRACCIRRYVRGSSDLGRRAGL
jgi:hypothetical protein